MIEMAPDSAATTIAVVDSPHDRSRNWTRLVTVTAAAAASTAVFASAATGNGTPLWLTAASAGGLVLWFASISTLGSVVDGNRRRFFERIAVLTVAGLVSSALVALLVSDMGTPLPAAVRYLALGLAALMALAVLVAFQGTQREVRVLAIGSSAFAARLKRDAALRNRRIVAHLEADDLDGIAKDSGLRPYDAISVESHAFTNYGQLASVTRGFTGPVLVQDPTLDAGDSNAFDPCIPMVGQFCKRVVDLLVASVLLVALAPGIGIAAILIRRESPGPALFRQARVGRDGRLFTMYKLRTMRAANDDTEHRAYLATYIRGDASQHNGMFKLPADPRVTPLGQRLRALSIDEVPQLLNVLTGTMSLVGPRPPIPHEVDQYNPVAWQRLRVKPGLTGPWQVRGRCELSFADQVELDHGYWRTWKLRTDFKILAQTPMAVLSRRGAR